MAVLICLIGALAIGAGIIAFIASLIESDRANKRDWAKYAARAERNAWRDAKGLTKL